MKMHILAAVIAIIAAPAFAEKTPFKPDPDPQCNDAVTLMLIKQVQQDIDQLQTDIKRYLVDLEEVQGDQAEAAKKIQK